jgi:hypothetical protein
MAMATVERAISEVDVVELLESVGRWPVGTSGTVVHDLGDWKQIEIADDRGVMLDLISALEPKLRLVAKHSA